MDATTTRITSIVIRHVKHLSCSYEGSTVEIDGDDDGQMSHAAYQIALVHFERESMEDVAGGGGIGGGSREIVLVVDDGGGEVREVPDDDDEGRALLANLPPGRIAPETVAELSAPVWDGNNHTSPDVTGIAVTDSYGHWSADDWLGDAGLDGSESARELVREAAAIGVHLDERDVQQYLDGLAAEQGD